MVQSHHTRALTFLACGSGMEEVIQRVNATHYGLAVDVFTQSLDAANTLSRALHEGM